MIEIMRRNAGLISAIVALVLIFAVYCALSTVDLVFMQGDKEVHRMDDVGMFSSLVVSEEDTPLEFTYTSGDATKDFGDNFEFRFEIAKTIFLNFVTFKWQDYDQVIILNAK